jgi:catechol 2,3-dioxygenase-like lactoylglutathione lyase family enzyme
MATNYPINPRVRAFGKARLDIAGRAKNQAQWEKLWKHPANSFPFVWGESWKQCVEYRVDDFPAEVGFYIDILGLPINALDPGYAMFTSPQGDFFFSVVPTPYTEQSTPPDAFRLQFMVKDIIATTQELQQRGIDLEQSPQPLHPGSSLSIASFRTPHGICVELWGKVEAGASPDIKESLSKDQENVDETDEDDDEFEVDKDETSENEAGKLEGVEEIGEDSDDDDLAEDLDDDEEKDTDEFEFDEDEDEFDEDEDDDDGDEDVSALKSDPQKSVTLNNPTLPLAAKSKSSEKMPDNKNEQGPEYIDLDIT